MKQNFIWVLFNHFYSAKIMNIVSGCKHQIKFELIAEFHLSPVHVCMDSILRSPSHKGQKGHPYKSYKPYESL